MSYLDSHRKKIDLKLELPISYYFKAAKQPTDKTILLLHGYQDSASSLFKRCFGESEQDLNFNIIAPNGAFPVPVKAEDGYLEAYAWYFVDAKRKIKIISPEVATANLVVLLDHLKLRDHKFLIIGFSQGGILASFVAHQIKNVFGIIGLGTMFFPEYYEGLSTALTIDAIHGTDDDVITLQTSQTGYSALKTAQPRPGDYYPIQGLKHTLDERARKKLNELIQLRLLAK